MSTPRFNNSTRRYNQAKAARLEAITPTTPLLYTLSPTDRRLIKKWMGARVKSMRRPRHTMVTQITAALAALGRHLLRTGASALPRAEAARVIAERLRVWPKTARVYLGHLIEAGCVRLSGDAACLPHYLDLNPAADDPWLLERRAAQAEKARARRGLNRPRRGRKTPTIFKNYAAGRSLWVKLSACEGIRPHKIRRAAAPPPPSRAELDRLDDELLGRPSLSTPVPPPEPVVVATTRPVKKPEPVPLPPGKRAYVARMERLRAGASWTPRPLAPAARKTLAAELEYELGRFELPGVNYLALAGLGIPTYQIVAAAAVTKKRLKGLAIASPGGYIAGTARNLMRQYAPIKAGPGT